jgi:hypothetical protein
MIDTTLALAILAWSASKAFAHGEAHMENRCEAGTVRKGVVK